MKQYPDEQSCKAAWKRHRDKAGVVCPVCGGIVHYWKRGQCKPTKVGRIKMIVIDDLKADTIDNRNR